MKRNKTLRKTGFKKKSTKPLKRTPINKVSKSKISVLKKKLWKVFSLYIRKRDKYICFTCGRKGSGSGIHAGHFIPKSIGGISLYFHEDNVHAQCYNCNINLGGNQWEYGIKLGNKKVEKLFKLKNKNVKWNEDDYLKKIVYYSNKL